ncbi:MAG TPA: hypothetical protein VKN14_06740 [Flavobacteriaceae bacterium]|nr:hypothetical protein [Flavobacteriaceae bacterium]
MDWANIYNREAYDKLRIVMDKYFKVYPNITERNVRPLQFKREYTMFEGFDYLRNENRTFNLTRIQKISIVE